MREHYIPLKNPLELSREARDEINTYKKHAFIGNSKQIFYRIQMLNQEWGTKFYKHEDEIRDSLCFAFIIDYPQFRGQIFIHNNYPTQLIPTGLEHEAVELYFLQHKRHAEQIISVLGLEEIYAHEPNPLVNGAAHYAALYFELKCAQELSILEEKRQFIASRITKWITQDASRLVQYSAPLIARDMIIHRITHS